MSSVSRREYLTATILDVGASVLFQFVGLFAILLAANYASLTSTAKLTLALSFAGPVSLLASMALTEKLIAGSDGYTDFCVVVVSRMLLFCLTFLLTVLVLAIAWRSKLMTEHFAVILCLVCGARLVDCVSDTAIQFHRRRRAFGAAFELAVVHLLVFLATFFVCYRLLGLDAAVASSWGMFASAVAAAIRATLSLPVTERIWPTGVFPTAVQFVATNVLRGGAHLVNSLQGIAPRFVLEIFAGPQSQAAFTILSSVARAGTIMLQSGFVPLVQRFAALHAREPRRALLIALISFAVAASVLGLGLAVCWWGGWRFDLIRWLGRDLQSFISLEGGLGVMIGVTLYMFRFAMWQVYVLVGAGDRLLAYASVGLAATTVAAFCMVPYWGIWGAALSDAIGSVILVGIPFFALWARGSQSKTQRPI